MSARLQTTVDLVLKVGDCEQALLLDFISGKFTANANQEKYVWEGRLWARLPSSYLEKCLPCFNQQKLKRMLSALVDKGILVRKYLRDASGFLWPHEADVNSFIYSFENEAEWFSCLHVPNNLQVSPKNKQVQKCTEAGSKLNQPKFKSEPTSLPLDLPDHSQDHSQENREEKTDEPAAPDCQPPALELLKFEPSRKPVSERRETISPSLPIFPKLTEAWCAYSSAQLPHLKPDPIETDKALVKVAKHLNQNEAFLLQLLDWVRNDDFWSKNAVSALGLLKKGSNGLRKIDNIVSKMRNDKAYKSKVIDQRLKESGVKAYF